jgi:hypothetical protein
MNKFELMKVGDAFEYLKEYILLMIWTEYTTAVLKNHYPTTANKSAYIS